MNVPFPKGYPLENSCHRLVAAKYTTKPTIKPSMGCPSVEPTAVPINLLYQINCIYVFHIMLI